MRLAIATSLCLVSRVAVAQPDVPPAEPTPAPAPVEEPKPVPPPPPVAQPVITAPLVPDEVKPTEPVRSTGDGFRFGSYGRLIAGSDTRGGKPERLLVGAVGPRVIEDSYLELEMAYGLPRDQAPCIKCFGADQQRSAFDGTLFHDTGDFDAHPALRNMYLERRPVISTRFSAWVGSRMYRGDDIYLFDYWPLDDQNTVGTGVLYRSTEVPANETGNALELAGHVGFNRLNDNFQFQQVEVANPEQGATTITQLNRERIIASATASYLMMRDPKLPSMKLKVRTPGAARAAVGHARISTRLARRPASSRPLPADSGYLIGAELSLFGRSTVGYHDHLNLFARYASGRSRRARRARTEADELRHRIIKTTNANEPSFGTLQQLRHRVPWQLRQSGALSRRFIDASSDDNTVTHADGWEYAIDARPLVRVLPDVFVGADISYQARFPRGLNPYTRARRKVSWRSFQLAPMVVYSPDGAVGVRPAAAPRGLRHRAPEPGSARSTNTSPTIRATRTGIILLDHVPGRKWWFNSLATSATTGAAIPYEAERRSCCKT